jgi:glutathione S-transferase
MRVWYIDGSPYARIIRATLIELGVAHEAIELASYPPAGIAELTPALQVPVLEDGGRRLFGSSLIREYLHATYADGAYPAALVRDGHRWGDAQVLTAITSLTESLVHYFHSKWAGVGPTGENRLGVDPAERDMERAISLLDWLEGEAGPDGFWPGVFSPADMALSAAVLWTEAREEIAWRRSSDRGRPKLERIVAQADARESFRRTAPRPWSGSPKGVLLAAQG